jgi:hypothetical protein
MHAESASMTTSAVDSSRRVQRRRSMTVSGSDTILRGREAGGVMPLVYVDQPYEKLG